MKEIKKQWRTEMLDRRNGLDVDVKSDWDELLCEHLMSLVEDRSAQVVHVFLPMGSEPDLYPFIQSLLDEGKSVICPQALPDGVLRHLELNSLDSLQQGVMGTRYPDGDQLFLGTPDIVVVPGLAFDHQGYRLGYGGGYYDCFLKTIPSAFLVAAAYDFQYVAEVPREEHDVELDAIILPLDGLI